MDQSKGVGSIVVFCLMILTIGSMIGCEKPSVYTLTCHTGLADGGSIAITAEVYFKEKGGPQELASKIDQARYAMKMVFAGIKSSELQNQGKTKSENTLGQVLKQILSSPVVKTCITDYQVKEAS